MSRVSGGDGPRQREFLEATLPHLDTVHRIARHLAVDRWGAEDLVQETYLRAFAAFDRHRDESTRAWLAVICLNAARSRARSDRRRVREVPDAEAEPPPASPDPVAETALAGIERDAIDRALRQLPEEQRICILLMDVAGYSASEVAVIRGCGRGTVLSRVYRGRQKLAGLLAGLRADAEADRELP